MSEQKTINNEDVLKMAVLSRLRTAEEEQALFVGQFRDILGYMDMLAAVDTEGVEPLYSPASHDGLTREDVAAPGRPREEVLADAPQQNGECFVVPRIV